MKERVVKAQAAMIREEIPALLVTKPENQVYLSGFHSDNCYLILTKDKNYVLTDFRYIEEAQELDPLFETVLVSKDYTVLHFLKELNTDRLAIEEDHVSVKFYKELTEGLDTAFCGADGIIEKLRSVKDQTELDAITRAEALGDECFTHMLSILRPGMTELEAAFEIEQFLRKNGATRISFDTICVSGPRTSLPHGIPTIKKMETGDFITLDFGCVIDGYCSDMTRTVALGTVTKEQRDIYNLVLKAQNAGCRAVKAGISCREADGIVRNIIADEGYGEAFGHGTGHGVGLEIHEAPTLNPRSEEVLQENMIVTIEPGIYLPKKFGVRIEDLAIVTASGIINLSKSAKELIVI